MVVVSPQIHPAVLGLGQGWCRSEFGVNSEQDVDVVKLPGFDLVRYDVSLIKLAS
jgi:hypothetical protein